MPAGRSNARIANREGVALLLQAISVRAGEHSFATSDLLYRLPAAADATLRAAMVRACGSGSPLAIGQLLTQYEGETVGGIRITRDGRTRDGIC